MQQDPFTDALTLAAARDDVILSREARRLGLSKREVEHLQRAAGQHVVRGAIAVPPVRDPLRTAARAAQLAVPAGVVSHQAAAHLHGLQGLGFWQPDAAIDMTLPAAATRRQRNGVRLHFRPLTAHEIVEVRGLLVTSVGRTLADCARAADRVGYISIVDSALHKGLLQSNDLSILAEALCRSRCWEASRWLEMVDGRAESPSETRVRLVLSDAGIPPDDLQFVVREDDGWIVARLDMAYRRPARRVGLEVDSAEHDRVRALYRDREKHNALRALGWDVRQVTAFDAARRPAYVIGQVRDALGMR